MGHLAIIAAGPCRTVDTIIIVCQSRKKGWYDGTTSGTNVSNPDWDARIMCEPGSFHYRHPVTQDKVKHIAQQVKDGYRESLNSMEP